MRLLLTPHPDTPSMAVTRIAVTVRRADEHVLELRYEIEGDLAQVRWPALAEPSRTDELWKHTCLEAFVKPVAGETYVELNFAPSTQWAAYRFDGYRAGMTDAEIVAPQVQPQMDGAAFVLVARVELPDGGAWRLALSAVIEAADGSKSYWALAHPPGKPDFHHADSFAYALGAPEHA